MNNFIKEWLSKAYPEMSAFTKGIITGGMLGFGAGSVICYQKSKTAEELAFSKEFVPKFTDMFEIQVQTKNNIFDKENELAKKNNDIKWVLSNYIKPKREYYLQNNSYMVLGKYFMPLRTFNFFKTDFESTLFKNGISRYQLIQFEKEYTQKIEEKSNELINDFVNDNKN